MLDRTTMTTSRNMPKRLMKYVRIGNSIGRDEGRSEIFDQLLYGKANLQDSRILRRHQQIVNYNDASLQIQSERLPIRLFYYRPIFVFFYPLRGFSSSVYCS